MSDSDGLARLRPAPLVSTALATLWKHKFYAGGSSASLRCAGCSSDCGKLAWQTKPIAEVERLLAGLASVLRCYSGVLATCANLLLHLVIEVNQLLTNVILFATMITVHFSAYCTAAVPLLGRAAATPLLGRAAATPLLGRAAATLLLGRAAAMPLLGRAAATPLLGRAAAMPLLGCAAAMPLLGCATAFMAHAATARSAPILFCCA